MSLIDAVQTIGLDKTDAQIVAALGESVALPYNSQRWTYAGVAAEFGPTVAEGLSAVMTGAGLTTAVIAYATVGFDLSLDATRAQLDAIATAVPTLATACDALKAIGRPTGPRWQHAGLSSLPTESDVAAARRQIDVSQRWAYIANEVVPPLRETATWQEIKDAIQAVW
jgi:hypothetical protein